MNSYEIAVIGAGMAGLTCAQQLQQMGYQVVVLDKSRGVGGRVATRRVAATVVDHGARYLEPQGPLTESLIQVLMEQQKLQLWSDRIDALPADQPLHAVQQVSISPGLPRYIAPTGMTTIPKFLATGLTMYLGQLVKSLTLTPESTWQLQLEPNQPDCPAIPTYLEARSLVIAIPAPQALALLSPMADRVFPEESLNLLRSMTYDPCLSVMAGYSDDRLQALKAAEFAWRAIDCPGDSHLQWIGWDHAKRSQPKSPICVVNTTATFAQHYLEASNLQPAGQQILSYLANSLAIPWLTQPEWMQVHRWRFAFPATPTSLGCWVAHRDPLLICTGDWCEGHQIEAALRSGLAASRQVNSRLRDCEMQENPWELLRNMN